MSQILVALAVGCVVLGALWWLDRRYTMKGWPQ